MTEHDKDLILNILEKAREFRKISAKSQNSFNDKNSLDDDMSSHIVKTGRIVQELFELIDEFEATEGKPTYMDE